MSKKAGIRKVEMNDLDACYSLIEELAIYEKAPNELVLTPETFKADFSKNRFDAFVCEINGEIVGMALYYPIYSTWKGHSMHLEDLIVRQSQRRKGLGTLLFDAVV
ncbi:MAG: GNAT family N-acetyltransferase, partial [Bacteroidetes bacterium]|nr:GNAT family N-acetyltransferase [Bacteroidota bacterium]